MYSSNDVSSEKSGQVTNNNNITFTLSTDYCLGGGPIFLNGKQFIPVKVVYNFPRTICYFPDGTKTIVRCTDDEKYDKEKGVMACIIKKLFKSRKEFKKLVESGRENEIARFNRMLHDYPFDKGEK